MNIYFSVNKNDKDWVSKRIQSIDVIFSVWFVLHLANDIALFG